MWPGYGFVATTALVFGSAPTFARLAFEGGVDPLSLQVFRFVITASAILSVVVIARCWPRITLRQFVRLCLIALCTGVSSYCYMTAVRYVPVPVASLVFFTFPLIVGPLAHVLGIEQLTRRRIAAILVTFFGLCLVLGYDLQLDWYGVGLAFLAGFSVAVSFVVSRPLTRVLPALTITAFSTGLPCLAYLAIGLAGDRMVFPETTAGIVGVIVNGLCFAAGLACLYASIRRLGALRTAVLINLEPLVSIGAAYVVLGQTIAPGQMIGALVVVTGIVVMQTGRSGRS